MHITAFSQSKFTGCLPHVYPQLAHGRRKESSWETHRIVQKRAQDLCRKGLRPPDFIGTLVPNFGCAGDQGPWHAPRGPDRGQNRTRKPKISPRGKSVDCVLRLWGRS